MGARDAIASENLDQYYVQEEGGEGEDYGMGSLGLDQLRRSGMYRTLSGPSPTLNVALFHQGQGRGSNKPHNNLGSRG